MAKHEEGYQEIRQDLFSISTKRVNETEQSKANNTTNRYL